MENKNSENKSESDTSDIRHPTSQIEYYLDRLAAHVGDERLPGLDETLRSYAADAGLRGRIAALAGKNAAGRFYAAVLLAAVDREKADELFEQLKNERTPLTVQKSVGFGSFELPAALLAADFLEAKEFPGPHFRRAEALAGWHTAVALERRKAGRSFDETELPRYAEAVEARADRERAAALRGRLEKLKAGGAAERFYAAAIAGIFDEAEARAILEALLDEPAAVAVPSGDLVTAFPASRLAAELLGLKPADEPQSPKGPLERFFKWLGG